MPDALPTPHTDKPSGNTNASQDRASQGRLEASARRVDVLILTALKDELQQLEKVEEGALGAWEEGKDRSGFPYKVRDFQSEDGHRLRVAATRATDQGAELTAVAATAMVRELRPTCLAMCGICAGRRGKVSLGDVIVADKVFKYDVGKLKAFVDQNKRTEEVLQEQHVYNLAATWKRKCEDFPAVTQREIARKRPATYEARGRWLIHSLAKHQEDRCSPPSQHPRRRDRCPNWPEVLHWLRQRDLITPEAPLELIQKGWKKVENERLEYPDGHPGEPPFAIHVGPLATGGNVIVDTEAFDRLEKMERNVLGLDREAAAIGMVAHETGTKWMIVVKAVQDYADPDKDDSMRGFAASASARFFLEFLRQQLPESSTYTNSPSPTRRQKPHLKSGTKR